MAKKKNAPPPKFPRRYALYRLLHLVVLLYLSFAGWSRFALAFGLRSLLESIQVNPGPVYLALGGALWGLLGLGGAALLFVRKLWARLAVFGIALIFAISYWIDRLLFIRSADMQANWPYALVLTVILLAFSASLVIVLLRWEEKLDASGKRPGNRS
jgi:hypothetical protein